MGCTERRAGWGFVAEQWWWESRSGVVDAVVVGNDEVRLEWVVVVVVVQIDNDDGVVC